MNELRNAFPGQKKNEPVFIFLHAYYLAFLPYLLGVLVMLGVGVVLLSFTLTNLKLGNSIQYNWALAGSGSFLLFAILFSTIAWFDFYFDIHIVTDQRIVDINQNRLFNRFVSELNIEDIEDVSVHSSGILSTLFNFGNVEIQTAGTRNNFTFQHISNPREVGSIISDLAEQAKQGVKDEHRFPSTPAKGVINNEVLRTRNDLIKMGALKPDEKINE